MDLRGFRCGTEGYSTDPLSPTHQFHTRTRPFQHQKPLSSASPQLNTEIPQFNTKNSSVPPLPQFHTKNTSVSHQNPLSSTPPPQFHTKKPSIQHQNQLSSTPKTPQFHTAYIELFLSEGCVELRDFGAEKDWPFCVELMC